MNIILCGYKSSGKTQVGQHLAQHYSCDFIDTDARVKAAFNAHRFRHYSISDIYEQIGESRFRHLELVVLKELAHVTHAVIATGGGTLKHPDSIRYLKSLGVIIYLKLDKSVLYQRLLNSKDPKPAFISSDNPAIDFENYWTSRVQLYQDCADKVIDTTNKTIDEVAVSIQTWMANRLQNFDTHYHK